MKRLSVGIMVLLLICTLVLTACADVKGILTTQTRDILLMEEIAEFPPTMPVHVQSTAQGLAAVELHRNDFEVTLAADKPGGQYSVGEKIVLSVTSKQDGYLTLLDFTPNGQIIVLYPNAWVDDNSMKAGKTLTIPADETKYILRAGGPVGVDVVKAIVTDKLVQVYDEANKDVAGPFGFLKDTMAATRDLLLIAEPIVAVGAVPDEAAKLAVASYAVMTNLEVNDAPTGFAVVNKGDWQAKMWMNDNNFLVGERVFVKLLSNKSGKLVSLVNAGASSSENNLLPEDAGVVFNAGEILTFPRGEDKWKLVATEDAGEDSIMAKLALYDGTELDIELKLIVNNDLEG